MEPVFYKCPACGNVMMVMVGSGIVPVCCGKSMVKMEANVTDGKIEAHVPAVTCKEVCHDPTPCYEVCVSVGSMPHPMTEEHHICFIYMATKCGGEMKILKSGHDAKAVFYTTSKPTAIFAYCNLHDLWKVGSPCNDKWYQ